MSISNFILKNTKSLSGMCDSFLTKLEAPKEPEKKFSQENDTNNLNITCISSLEKSEITEIIQTKDNSNLKLTSNKERDNKDININGQRKNLSLEAWQEYALFIVNLTPLQRKALGTLWGFFATYGEVPFPSVNTIAKKSKVAEVTVQRLFRKIRKSKNPIILIKDHFFKKRQTSNRYHLHPEARKAKKFLNAWGFTNFVESKKEIIKKAIESYTDTPSKIFRKNPLEKDCHRDDTPYYKDKEKYIYTDLDSTTKHLFNGIKIQPSTIHFLKKRYSESVLIDAKNAYKAKSPGIIRNHDAFFVAICKNMEKKRQLCMKKEAIRRCFTNAIQKMKPSNYFIGLKNISTHQNVKIQSYIGCCLKAMKNKLNSLTIRRFNRISKQGVFQEGISWWILSSCTRMKKSNLSMI